MATRRHQRVTIGKTCPVEECGSSSILKDKHEAGVFVCTRCGLKYQEVTCEICGSKKAILNKHNKKIICKNCGVKE